MHTSMEYFLRILFDITHIDVKNISRDGINMAVKMVYDDDTILDRLYSFIVSMPSLELKEDILKLLVVSYAKTNGDVIDKNITYLAETSKDDVMHRFIQDSNFGIDLLNSFIRYLDSGEYPEAISENLANILKININYDIFAVMTLEEVLNDAFVKIMKVVYDTVHSPSILVSLMASLFFGGKLISLQMDIDKEVELIQTYRNYFIKMGYARLYALEVGCDDFEFDGDFLTLFDEHVFQGNLDLDNINYAKAFVSAYIKSFNYKKSIHLSENQLSYVRTINPLYTGGCLHGR